MKAVVQHAYGPPTEVLWYLPFVRSQSTTGLLLRLERIARKFGGGEAPEKLRLLRAVSRRRLTTPRQVRRFHEVVCFLRAYPDDAELLGEIERQVETFGERKDVGRFREKLMDSGIAGTPIHYQFHWKTACWLASNWPDLITVDWSWFDIDVGAAHLLHLLVPRTELIDPDALDLSTEDWVARLKGAWQTDAVFLIRRFEKLEVDEVIRQTLYETLDLPVRLSPGPTAPSRTRAKVKLHPPVFQKKPLSSTRPVLATAVRFPPRAVRDVSARRAHELILIGREAMVTRARDLHAFQHANPDDVRLIDAGDGITLSCIGVLPDYRALVETVYVFVLHKNGVPIGYYQSAILFGSAELNYNIFEPFRGTQAGEIYGKALSAVHYLFGSNVFAVDPYQLGQDNEEALASGSFWFYQKLGFQPEESKQRRVLAEELKRLAKNPSHRSSRDVLRELADAYVFFYLGRKRDDVAGKVSLDHIGLAISEWVGARYGDDRERCHAECAGKARRLLGLSSLSRLSHDERRGFERWSPLVCMLGVETWTRQERRDLLSVIRAKVAPREEDFALRLERHARLRRALVRLSKRPT